MVQRLFSLLLIHLIIGIGVSNAQEYFPFTGVKDERYIVYAFNKATVVVSPDKILENATLLIQKEKIIAVGTDIKIPEGAVVYNLEGKYIYPSLIDIHTTIGMPPVKKAGNLRLTPVQIPPVTPGAFNANDAIKSQFNAVDLYSAKKLSIDAFRNNGFGAVLSFREDGIIRGTSVLVSLLDSSEINKAVLLDKASLEFSFDKGSSLQLFPVSDMGMVALLRQTLYDALWYKNSKPNFVDESLVALNKDLALPKILSANTLQNVINAGKITSEFKMPIIVKVSGEEYKDIEKIKELSMSLIVPLNFPKPYDVADPLEAEQVSLSKLKEWELAPYNVKYLQDAGAEIALTTYGCKDAGEFLQNLKKSIQCGFTAENALRALTITPAKLLQVDDKLGTLEAGKYASFIISSDSIFADKNIILENWILGKRFILHSIPEDELYANYDLKIGVNIFKLTLKPGGGKPEFNVFNKDSVNLKAKGSISNNIISLSFQSDTLKGSKRIRLSGWYNVGGDLAGEGQNESGEWFSWRASRVNESGEEKKNKDKSEKQEAAEIWFPFEAYGRTKLPEAKDFLIKNATVWVMEGEEEVLTNADVLVKNGKISKVGKNLTVGYVEIIDGTGKHVTPGIIDEHSHIALTSVNDIAVNSAMVRMQDVIDPGNIYIYRQLAGGVTTAQLLHGSANPIGGQSAIIKFRWGENADGLLINDATPFIKFALGENVKRSNAPVFAKRYPNTRMGVEQVYEDAFSQAQQYKALWDAYLKNPKLPEPRKDLALDPLVEILQGKRQITCHSYIQSEINMLMKLADRYNFKVNTFTHILEGYKVADKMKEHGAGGSTFSDWWGYKFEVYEATAYNAALMMREGITVAINSDDAEMARRLNQEAAKTIKYGGMSEVEAMKMVTLNPAKLLHLDHRIGSIIEGKDADLVVWNDNPLSIYAKPEKTFIDGRLYFDIEEDKILREQNLKERNRIIQKMIEAKNKGADTKPVEPSGYIKLDCDDIH
jgi:imidazolonepropionase-like amidohydrolase